MIKMKKLLNERDDSMIERFISLLPEYDLEFCSWDKNPEFAFKWRNGTYPTVTDKEHTVQVGLDRTDIFPHNGQVWVGSSSNPIKNGFVIQGIVTNPVNRGQGHAKNVLKRVLQCADKAGITLKLEPVPMKDFIKKGEPSLTKQQLQKWYAKHGFEKHPEANIMTRGPKQDTPPVS